MITDEMRKKLRAPLPGEAVTKHPTKTYLSSIKAIYVTERFNEVFGVGAWRTKVERIERVDGGVVVVKVTLEVPEHSVYYESYGGNDNGGENNKNFDLGDAYKGATTDAITKIGSYLEVGIDVFKGKANVPTPPSNQSGDKLWLNNTGEAWDKALKYMQEGGDIQKIKDKYKVSKDNQELLTK